MSISLPKEAPQRTDTLPDASDQSPLHFNLRIALVVFLTYFFLASRLNENFQMLGLIALLGSVAFFDRLVTQWWTWAAISFSLFVGIALRPLDVPNHHFMLFYTSLALAMTLAADPRRRLELVQVNFRWIVVALMGIATIQRLVQPDFISGDYLGLETAIGGFANPVLKFFPEQLAIAVENRSLLGAFRDIPPSTEGSITLPSPVPSLPLVANLFMITILAIEAWICFLMWKAPKHWITHLSIMAFGLSLVVLRQELVFISVICLLGLLTCHQSLRRIRIAYGILAVLVAASVVKTVVQAGPLQ